MADWNSPQREKERKKEAKRESFLGFISFLIVTAFWIWLGLHIS